MPTFDFYSVPILDQRFSEGFSGSTVCTTRYDIGSARRHTLRINSLDLVFNLGFLQAVLISAFWALVIGGVIAFFAGGWASNMREEQVGRDYDAKVSVLNNRPQDYQRHDWDAEQRRELEKLEAERKQALAQISPWFEMYEAVASTWCIGIISIIFVVFVVFNTRSIGTAWLMKQHAKAARGMGFWGKIEIVPEAGWKLFAAACGYVSIEKGQLKVKEPGHL